MDKVYYDAVTEMEKMNVNREYALGWMGGYLQNPMREEQRVTEAYEAGHTDGSNHSKSNFAQWANK